MSGEKKKKKSALVQEAFVLRGFLGVFLLFFCGGGNECRGCVFCDDEIITNINFVGGEEKKKEIY